MKKNTPIFRSQPFPRFPIYFALCLLLIALCAVGCANGDAEQPVQTEETTSVTEPTSDTSSPTPPQTQPEPSPDKAEDELRVHYEALISELRAELLKEREDRYISDFEYTKRLEELEQALKDLESVTHPNDTPTSAPVETEPTETEAPQKPSGSTTFNYRLEDSQVIITGYTGTAEIVNVPSVIDGHPVVAIDDYAFQNTSVVSVILPATVTSVGWFAFYGCFGLEIISIPASVTAIEYAAFDGCPRLTILCTADSYAARYAVSFGLKHEYV